MAPMLGVTHAGGRKPAERVAFVADHLLYGLVLAEPRRPPQPS